MKLSVKKGDYVKIIAGNDKGKTAQILAVDAENGRVTIEGKDIKPNKKAVKARRASDRSGIIDMPKTVDVSNLGDIAVMLKLPDCERRFPAETVTLPDHGIRTDRNSDVLLLGDSFANIYSSEALKWGTDGGLAETLGAMRGAPVDAIIRNDAGAFATRQLLANELLRGHDRLAGKKIVVWEFAIRELANGDWKILELPQVKKSSGDQTASVVPEARTVDATVLKISAVPRPNSAPYKDHVVSLHIAVDGGDKVLVYAVSMRDNIWTKAAKLRVGEKIKIKLEPWEKREAEFGSWNRSEFDDEELLLAEPLYGEIVSAK